MTTHAAAQPAEYVASKRPATPRKRKPVPRQPGCKVRCTGGKACVCRADVTHSLHTCRDEFCICRDDVREMRGGVVR